MREPYASEGSRIRRALTRKLGQHGFHGGGLRRDLLVEKFWDLGAFARMFNRDSANLAIDSNCRNVNRAMRQIVFSIPIQ